MTEEQMAVRQLALAVERLGNVLEEVVDNIDNRWDLVDTVRTATAQAKAINWVFFK